MPGPPLRPPFGELGGIRASGADYLSRLMTSGLGGHEALQRQMMYERERGLLAGPLASQHLQQRQHEEFIRYLPDKL